MNPEDYLQAIETQLLADDLIAGYEIVRKQFTTINAQVRIRLVFVDESRLEFSEYVRIDDKGDPEVVVYSYHWMSHDNQLRMRWDNAPHYPELAGFPHHVHDGGEKNVSPGEPMSLSRVLSIVANRIR